MYHQEPHFRWSTTVHDNMSLIIGTLQ